MTQTWILGITAGPHDSGAALFRDGDLVAAVNEERFSRKKMDGRFPDRCLEHCLRAGGIEASQLHVVAHGWNMAADAATLELVTGRLAEESPEVAREMQAFLEATNTCDRDVLRRLEAGLERWGIPRWKLQSYDHHLCHAAAALAHSRTFALDRMSALTAVEDQICVTLDGRGDYMSGRIVRGDLSVIAGTTMFDSIGFLWAFVTAALSFKPFRHEGKVLGLAAKGDPAQTLAIFQSFVALAPSNSTAGRWNIRVRWSVGSGANFIPYFAELERDPGKAKSTLENYELCQLLRRHRREDVAAGLQAFTESIVVEYLRRNGFLRRSLCVSGGVFSNVRLNMCLKELPEVDSFFVYPNMGDGGLCVGAALLAARERCHDGPPLLLPNTVFLGPELTPEVADLPQDRVTRLPDERSFAAVAAEAIHAGLVVGLFWGSMEFGPRALGRRSLLCMATKAKINEKLNARLKRSEFMPFAPVTLRAHAAEAYPGWSEEDEATRFMTVCYETSPAFRAECPAVVHVDGTARPQVVDDRDGLYYFILSEYHRLSGIPTFINTSFNIHEEPIVCSVADAVRSFEKGACDVLAVYPYIVK